MGSSGRVRRGGGKKHEIYVAAFGGHLFYDQFLQGGGMAPSAPQIHYWTNWVETHSVHYSAHHY